jgi:hypothetical protein
MVISSLEEHYLRAGSACQMTLTIPQTGRSIKTKHPPISFDLTLPTSTNPEYYCRKGYKSF